MSRILAVTTALALCAGVAHAEVGIASFYGGRDHGGPTASGERFNEGALTAAHPTLPVRAGIRLRVTRLDTGASVVVRVNDRGPARWTGRVIDLSRPHRQPRPAALAGLFFWRMPQWTT